MLTKGISPLIAAVLLIGLVVAIGGVMFIWLTGYTGETTKKVTEKGREPIECIGGVISLENLKYCGDTKALTGVIANLGTIDLKNVSLIIYYPARPIATYQLCEIGGKVKSCNAGNLTAKKGSSYWFNVTADPAIAEVRLTTACPGIYDRVAGADITLAC